MIEAETGLAPAGLIDNWIRRDAARSAAAMLLVTFTQFVLLTPTSSRYTPASAPAKTLDVAAKICWGFAGFRTKSVTPLSGRPLAPEMRAQVPPPSSDR